MMKLRRRLAGRQDCVQKAGGCQEGTQHCSAVTRQSWTKLANPARQPHSSLKDPQSGLASQDDHGCRGLHCHQGECGGRPRSPQHRCHRHRHGGEHHTRSQRFIICTYLHLSGCYRLRNSRSWTTTSRPTRLTATPSRSGTLTTGRATTRTSFSRASGTGTAPPTPGRKPSSSSSRPR